MVSNLSRRRFLGYTGAAAVAATSVGWGIEALLSRAGTDPLPPGAGVLVMLTLYGGNDGLNTVIPASDPAYHDARPQLAYTADQTLPLGEDLGLNPAMTGMKSLWDDDRLAIVRGVSYPKPDHSHFRSMDIWQTGSPDHPISTGWLGRWLDATGGDPLHAVSLEPVLPPMLAGATTAGAAIPVTGLTLPQHAFGAAFETLGTPTPGESGLQATAARAITDLHRAAIAIGPALTTHHTVPPTSGTGGDAGQNRKQGSRGGDHLSAQLSTVASLIEASAPARVYSVSLGGFDTHTGERSTQQRLLGQLDHAVSGFVRRMNNAAHGRDVVLVAYTEFGRRVQANANQGTDHGTAGPVFVTGNRVRGGFVGAQPSLTDLDDGDVKPTCDFRDIYATLLSEVLATDPQRILGPGRTTLPLIAST